MTSAFTSPASPVLFALLAATFLGLGTGQAAELPKEVIPFLENHCYECHDDVTDKGDLNLLDLAFDPNNPANFKRWLRVMERVEDGEMPPEKKPRPEKAESQKFLAGLSAPMLKADKQDVAENGRVRGRRLTRVQYEYTLHDLLGIDLPLQEQLPEDPMSNGFETVAAGQQLSHHVLARYLDVADQALEEAFTRALKGDAEYHKSCTPEDLAEKTRGNYRGPDLREGESRTWSISMQFFGRMPVTTVPEDGWYRIKIKQVRSINEGDNGSVWGTLRSGTCYSNAPMLYMVGLVEATPEPRDLVYEAWIRKGHMLELKPNDGELKRVPPGATGGNVSFKGRDLEKEGAPGIANKGIEIERIYPNADRKTVRKNLFGDVNLEEAAKNEPEKALDQMIARFARRAFRRPVDTAALQPYRDLGRQALSDGESLPEALKTSYRAILCSPRFLTFLEMPGKLDDHAIASRLSYALWVSMPDWELTKLANEGKLHQPAELKKQVDRMLKDKRSVRFVNSFTDQWLKLKEIDFTTPDTRQFPTFDPVLQESMVQETRAYVTELIRQNLGVEKLVDSDFAFLNGRLERHYWLEDEVQIKHGEGLQKVNLKRGKGELPVRGGLVTQGAILKVTADGTHTSPVVRGVFVNERILGLHIPPPPPNVPAIEPDIRGATSIRDQLEKHRNNESCASCHQKIDPPGFALENFDPVGRWRKSYGKGGKGAPVNPSGVTKDGAEFEDLFSWKEIFTARDEQLAKGFAEQFLTYATGAPIRFSDRETVASAVATTKDSGYGIRSILSASVLSPVFLNK